MVKTPPDASLGGLSVLVTRPRDQAGAFTGLIEGAGARAVRWPLLEIRPVGGPEAVKERLERLADFDLAIFVSRNAVVQAHSIVGPRLARLCQGLEVGSIGRATSRALADIGVEVSLQPPSPYTTETLLATLKGSGPPGRHIAILRGQGGREALGNELTTRGARVEYLELYERVVPAYSREVIRHTLRHGGIGLIAITSGEALRNLVDLARSAQVPLRDRPILVASQRIAGIATRAGLEAITVAENASDQAMFQATLRWREGQDRGK